MPKPIAVGEKTTVKQSRLPERYVKAVRDNEELQDCCRDCDDNTVELFKTSEDVDGPDLLVMECCDCGCKHYRLAAGSPE